MKKALIWIVLLAIVVIVAALGKAKKDVPQETADTPQSVVAQPLAEITTTIPSKSSSQEAIFTVQGGNFYFKPNIIKVKEGDTVTITFKNDGGIHDLVINELDVKTARLGSGAQEKVTFVATKKGSFEYYCSVGSHRQMGMKGTLIVE